MITCCSDLVRVVGQLFFWVLGNMFALTWSSDCDSLWKKTKANSVGGGTGHKDGALAFFKGEQYQYLGRCSGIFVRRIQNLLCWSDAVHRLLLSTLSRILLVAHVLSWGPGSLAKENI